MARPLRTETRARGWSFPARTTAYFLVVAMLSMAALTAVGLREIRGINQDNSEVRIDRAGRAAASLVQEVLPGFEAEGDASGSPMTVRIDAVERLEPGSSWDDLVDQISAINQGAANVFRFNSETQGFDRIATSFRAPDGARVGGSQIEPGLIGAGHPAYSSLVDLEPYIGEVPVAGRLRLAYLTPIAGGSGELMGLLAVDVGWVDDLDRINGVAAQRAVIAVAMLLVLMTALCTVTMFFAFRPLDRLIRVAHDIGTNQAPEAIELTNRRDEIGYLATGLSRVVELQRDLEHRAYSDGLTDIPNRTGFVRELEQRFGQLRNSADPQLGFALLIIDLDEFKEVNDGLGHQAGDELLVSLSGSLKDGLGPGEYLARLGGDEFAILTRVGALSVDEVEQTALRAMECISGVRRTSAGKTNITASIGIALIPEHGTTTQLAMSHADLALYAVKRDGRGHSKIYESSLSAPIQRRIHLAAELRRALAEGAICLEYQPIWGTSDGRVHSVEGLARWTHETEGVIPPLEFIHVAETAGLINELGNHVIELACAQIAEWGRLGLPVPIVSVNMSTIQLWQPSFLSVVRAALRRHGVPRGGLCLELTESVILQHEDGRHRDLLNELLALGVYLSVDDFGTGFSSLSYLRNLPVQELKVDRMFLAEADKDAQKAQLLSGIIALGSNLDLRVVVEGVETPEELEIAMSSGCDLVQGYFLARPMPPAQVSKLFGTVAPPWVDAYGYSFADG
jgi:diguanylate cyclase